MFRLIKQWYHCCNRSGGLLLRDSAARVKPKSHSELNELGISHNYQAKPTLQTFQFGGTTFKRMTDFQVPEISNTNNTLSIPYCMILLFRHNQALLEQYLQTLRINFNTSNGMVILQVSISYLIMMLKSSDISSQNQDTTHAKVAYSKNCSEQEFCGCVFVTGGSTHYRIQIPRPSTNWLRRHETVNTTLVEAEEETQNHTQWLQLETSGNRMEETNLRSTLKPFTNQYTMMN